MGWGKAPSVQIGLEVPGQDLRRSLGVIDACGLGSGGECLVKNLLS